MASTPGRNDPCPCGSGRKYKHCCLKAGDEVEAQWRALREAEGRIVPQIFGFVVDVHGKKGIRAAWDYFCARQLPLEDAPQNPDFEQLFTTWLLFDWQKPRGLVKFSTRLWPARPPAAEFLEQRGLGLAPLEERLVRAALDAPLSFMVVEAVLPGRSIGLRDIFTGARDTVLERSASQMVEPGNILLTRVVRVDAVSIMMGASHWVIPPPWHNHIITLRQRWTGGAMTLPAAEVKQRHAEIVDLYGHIVDRLLNPQPPKLQNTDGDPLAPTRLEFELGCSPQEAVGRLAPLAHGQDLEDLLVPEEKAAGDSPVYEVPWLAPGNPMHPDWENTSLGTMRLSEGRLEAEVNSERRARRLRKEIERRLKDRVVFLKQETLSVEAMLKGKGGEMSAAERREQEALQNHPEVKARMREMAERQWAAWLDRPVPALGGVTPREAARTPLGRERLEALFGEFAARNRHAPPEQRVDVARLRRELGLDEADGPME